MEQALNKDYTFLNIHLDKIQENYKIIKKQTHSNCEIAAVIKANAYGFGQEYVVNALYKIGCRKFCVAVIEEALQITTQYDDITVYIMHGVHSRETALIAVAKGFVPVLNTLEQIYIWNEVARMQNLQLPALLQIDTGMGRFGLSEKQIDKVVNEPQIMSHIKVEYIMSHMSCAEQPHHPLTQNQLALLKKYLSLFPQTKVTFANSAGIFLGEKFQFDMVRPGCALYGINPTSNYENPMHSVVELYGHIAQKNVIEREQFIGYRAQYRVQKDDKVIVVECGYADGYMRSLSNKGICYANGYFMPVAGIISMDVVMIDASILPEEVFQSITHVELLGEHITIDDVAKHANTISYEILTTRFGNRCKRYYIGS